MSSLEMQIDLDDEIQENQMTVLGENGTLEYTAAAVGDDILALFVALVRNIDTERLISLLDTCLNVPTYTPLSLLRGLVTDLFVLIFQTRDCRGGKGEKKLFFDMFLYIAHTFPTTCSTLLPLIKEYGSFRDYYVMDQMIHLKVGQSDHLLFLSQKILDFTANQLIEDERIFEDSIDKVNVTGLSFCAKYSPREGKKLAGEKDRVIKELVSRLYDTPVTMANKKKYRQLLSKLTSALAVPEIFMCGKRYRDIKFDRVPSQCLNKNRFINSNIYLFTIKL